MAIGAAAASTSFVSANAGGKAASTIATQAALAASAAVSAIGTVQQGRAAQSAASFEAVQLQQQAERDREIARRDADELRRNEARRRAALRAAVGGSGVTLEGTPLAVLSDLAAEAEFQALRLEAGGETQAGRAEGQAAVRRLEGRQAQRAGFTRAGASLLAAGARSFGSTT